MIKSLPFLLSTLLFYAFNCKAQAPLISYNSSQTYTVGTAITPLASTNTGGAVPPANYQQVTTIAGYEKEAHATFYNPTGIVLDSKGNLVVSNPAFSRIDMISPGGLISTLAGAYPYGFVNGTGTAAKFNNPKGLAIDASDNIYVADYGNNVIRKITPAGVATTFAGSNSGGYANGPAASATFSSPQGLAFDAVGNLYVTEMNGAMVRKISTAGIVSDVADAAYYYQSPPSPISPRYCPYGITVDADGSIFVTIPDGNMIRKITTAGVVTTFAGNGTAGFTNGTGTAATFKQPEGICADAAGNLYVADAGNKAIRMITPQGVVTTLAGFGTATGSTDGPVATATLFGPDFITLYRGSLYFTQFSDPVRTIGLTGYTIAPALPDGLTFDSKTGIISGTPTTASANAAYTITAYNTAGSSTAQVQIKVIYPTPVITSFTPVTAAAGTVITITGTNFSNVTGVNIGGVPAAAYYVSSSTLITASVPANAASGDISVTTAGGKATLSGFIFVPTPAITSFTPTSALPGTTVTVTGTNFSDVTAVKFGGTAAQVFSVISPSLITATVPLGSASGSVSVTSVGGTGSLAGFTYIVPPPVITSISPASATPGTTVNITGTNLNGATTINFGGTPALFYAIVSSTTIQAVVGQGSSGNVSVTTPGGTVNFAGFTFFVPIPAIVQPVSNEFLIGSGITLSTVYNSVYTYQWYKDGVAVGNAYNYYASLTGVYTVSITAGGITQMSAPVALHAVLAAASFKISVLSATCKGQNNGSVLVTAVKAGNYLVNISGGGNYSQSTTFASTFTAYNLTAGTYNICLSQTGYPAAQQCYTVVVTEPKDLALYSVVDKKTNSVDLTITGANTYTVNLNGRDYTSTSGNLTLPLVKGQNTLSVESDKPCQGIIEKRITLTDDITAYPNPFSNQLILSLSDKTVADLQVNIIDSFGKPVYTKRYSNQSGEIALDVGNLPGNQVYILKLVSDGITVVSKIIKK